MSTTILLFRQDLRLHDHPALTAAAQRGDVLPVFIYDEQVAGDWGFGGASQWWLHESLASLSVSIDSLGGRLIYRRGNTVDVLLELQESVQADAIYFSRQYQPWSAGLEASINDVFGHKDVEVKRYPGTLLHEPGSVLTGSGTLFKVFTPFWRAANKLPTAMRPITEDLMGRYRFRNRLTTGLETSTQRARRHPGLGQRLGCSLESRRGRCAAGVGYVLRSPGRALLRRSGSTSKAIHIEALPPSQIR